MAEDSCARPTRGPILAAEGTNATVPMIQESMKMMARVGKPAPDFETTAYVDGKFKSVKLSDYKGHWVLVCFYPGDFTFV